MVPLGRKARAGVGLAFIGGGEERMTRRLLGLAAAAIAGLMLAPPAAADERARAVEDLMREYVRLWNAGDAEAITSRIYRLDGGGPTSTPEGLRSSFAALKQRGYSHSNLHSVEGCVISPNLALARMHYSRMKTDGAPLAADLVTLYKLRRTPDGWRIAELMTMDRSTAWDCKSMTAEAPAPAR